MFMEPAKKKQPEQKPADASNRRLRFDAPAHRAVKRPYFLQRKDRPGGR
ncbi:MAG: hypothetical protein V3R99_02925 [Thermoguttaceae bacterium]